MSGADGDPSEGPAFTWLYCIPHEWPEPRTTWEDVYLLPAHAGYDGPGIHLTVDSLGHLDDPDRAEGRAKALASLRDRDYVIDRSMGNMLVKVDDFSRDELIGFARVFLEDVGGRCDSLVEAPPEVFLGRIAHADLVAELTEGWKRRSQ